MVDAVGACRPVDPPTESNRNHQIVTADLPAETTLEPRVGMLHLPSVLEGLAKHPIVVAQAIAVCWVIEGRQTIEKTGGKTTETAVAEPWVRFLLEDRVAAAFGSPVFVSILLIVTGFILMATRRFPDGVKTATTRKDDS